jgi:Protein kinase domain
MSDAEASQTSIQASSAGPVAIAPDRCPACGHSAPTSAAVSPCPGCQRLLAPLFAPQAREPEGWVPAELDGYLLLESARPEKPGRTFRARHRQTNALVGVRFLALGADPANVLRLERTVKLLQALNHPALPRYREIGQVAGRSYVVREWLEGQNLDQLLRDRSEEEAFPFVFVRDCFEQLSSALRALHTRGIVHGRIAPGRILVLSDGRLRLLDPELRAPESAEEPLDAAASAFQAPERLHNPTVEDGRSDVYSLGVVLYRLLTGFLPGDPLLRPSVINPSVPPWFEGILLSMLATDPAQRSARPGERTPKAGTERNGLSARQTGALGGAIVGAIVGAIAMAVMGESLLIGALVGLLPGALTGAFFQPGNESTK